MKFHIITIFPEMFDSYLNESIIKRAREAGDIEISLYNPRDFTEDKHKTVDDRPYGGGPGMVMRAEPILKAIERAYTNTQETNVGIVIFAPSGEELSNTLAQEYLDGSDDIIMICGRYEGIDTRVKEILIDTYGSDALKEISIGNYTLTGGELPAMVMIDTLTRRIPGVLGNEYSVEESRTAAHEMYTRPERIEYGGKGYSVPEVLTSGDHKKIEKWREEKSPHSRKSAGGE